MEKLKVIKLSDAAGEYSEGQIQKAFELALDDLEPGLQYVGSLVNTNVGTIDTLAVDEDNRPVIIEFKGPGGSGSDGLLQAIDYAVGCRRNFTLIEKIIQQAIKKELKISQDFRIIVIAPDFDERAIRAAYGVAFETKLFSFKLFEHEGETWILPNVEADASRSQRVAEVLPPKNVAQHLSGKPDSIKALYERLELELKKLDADIEINPAPQDYIGVKYAGYNFLAIHPKIKWIRLDVLSGLTADEADSPQYVYQESWDGGYFHLTSENFQEGMKLIRKALEKAKQD